MVYYIKGMMSESGRKQGKPVQIGVGPAPTHASIGRGKLSYEKFGCVACHGSNGKGDGPLAKHFPEHFSDPAGAATLPRDLTKGRTYFKSGGAPRDIVRTLVTGFEGTRMVSYLPVLENPKDLGPFWDIAHYLAQLSTKEASNP